MFFYRFEFADFEAGRLVARRLAACDHAAADWCCQAKTDRDALELAKRAATTEWPQPATRGVLDFIVAFIETKSD